MTTVKIGYAVQPTDSRPYPPNNPPGGGTGTGLGGGGGGIVNTNQFKKMTFHPLGSKRSLVIPFAPREVTYSNNFRQWTEVVRDGGRTPLLVNSSKGLKKMSFQLLITQLDYDQSVKNILNSLNRIASMHVPMKIGWSSWEVGHWRISGYTVSSMLRHPTSNEITRAVVEMEFTVASDAKAQLGPVSGGKKGNNGHDDEEQNIPMWYEAKKGDTLMKIAMKFYKDQSAWKYLAEINNIDKPHKELKVGQKIRLHK